MSLLLAIGSYALWFLVNVLVAMFFAVVSGFGLALGFKTFKDLVAWNQKRHDERKNKEYVNEMEEQVMAGAAVV